MKTASPLAIRLRVIEYSKRPLMTEITTGDLGAVVGEFNRVFENIPGLKEFSPDTCRYLTWGFCFIPDDQTFQIIKSKDLTDHQIYALKKWVGFYKDEKDKWQRRTAFPFEARGVFNSANAIHFMERQGPPTPMQDYLKSLTATTFEIDTNGVVQSAVEDLGGTLQILEPDPEPPPPTTYEPEGGYIPL